MSEAEHGEAEAGAESIDPATAFSIIGNGTRLEILEALSEAAETPMRFSDLYRRVDVDDSAQFNYHLGELRGSFVEKVDGGYELREAGRKVVSAIVAGSFTERPEIEPFDVGDPCVVCGAGLRARYADEQLVIECPDCGHGHGEYTFPPGGLEDRSREEILGAFNERVRHLHCLAADGVCPECSGRMETEIRDDPACCLGVNVQAHHACTRCGHEVCSAVELVLLDDADVTAFHRDHGIDLSTARYWTLEWCVSDEHTEVLDRDPARIAVTIPLDDEEMRVVLDDALGVEDVTRTPA